MWSELAGSRSVAAACLHAARPVLAAKGDEEHIYRKECDVPCGVLGSSAPVDGVYYLGRRSLMLVALK